MKKTNFGVFVQALSIKEDDMKILVVDDEPDLLEQLQETLTRQKYDVDTADDGELALG